MSSQPFFSQFFSEPTAETSAVSGTKQTQRQPRVYDAPPLPLSEPSFNRRKSQSHDERYSQTSILDYERFHVQ